MMPWTKCLYLPCAQICMLKPSPLSVAVFRNENSQEVIKVKCNHKGETLI